MCKKVLSVLLCTALLLSALSVGLGSISFAADEDYTISGDFVIDEASGTLVSYIGNDENVVVPDNLGIKIIGESAFAHALMKSVVLPDGLEEIYEDAFANCYYLESVTMTARILMRKTA